MIATSRDNPKRLNARSRTATAASVAIPSFQNVFSMCHPISGSELLSSRAKGLIPH